MKKTTITKLISLILILSCIIGLCPTQLAMADEGLTDEQKSLLTIVGVYDETLSLDSTLTKGEFANILANAVFSEGEDMTTYKPNTPLTDVDEFTDCYNAVSALHALGYAGVDKFGCFFPDSNITYRDAVSIIYRALGYKDSWVESKWKTPESFATSKKLSKGISVAKDGEVSVYTAYVLIYNMLNCDISDLFDGNDKIIYMNYKHDLYDIEGVVTHDGVVSFDPSKSVKPGNIMIDNDVFVNESGIADLFGQNITGYMREERDRDVLVAIYQNTRENEVITLASSDIVSMKNKTYSYYDGKSNSKLKTARFDNNSDIFYNGKLLGISDPFTDDMFIPRNGRVRLYNNDSDKTIEIVRIEDYDVGVVGAVDLENEKIYIDNSRIADLSTADYIIEDKYGNALELSNIVKNNVISYCKSFDGTVASVLVSTESYSDIVDEYESTGYGIITTESGARYELSEYAASNSDPVEAGEAYIFYFDAFDMLAGIKKDSEMNTLRYGYVAATAKEGNLGAKILMRVFTKSGEFVDYELNKKVKILDEKNKTNYLSQSDLYDTFSYKGLVRYKVNSDGKIAYIEVPLAYGGVPDTEDRLYYLIDTRVNGSKDDYETFEAGDGFNIGGAAIVTANTFVLHRPEDDTAYDDYRLGDMNSFKDYGNYEMFVYGTDYRKKISSAVVMYSAFSETITSEYPYVVKKVVKAYDPDEEQEAYKIDLMNNNTTESSYYMEVEDYENEVLTIANGITTPVRIQPGDIIYFAAGNGYIRKAIMVYDSDQEVPDIEGNMLKGAIAGTQLGYYTTDNKLCNPFYVGDRNAQNAGNSNNSWKYYTSNTTILSGWVYSIDDGYITITNQNPAYGIDLGKGREDGVVTSIYSYNRGVLTESAGKGSVNVKALSASDIKSYLDYGADCSRVVYVKYLWAGRMLNIIND